MTYNPSNTPDGTGFHVIAEANVLKEIVKPPVELANDQAAKFRWTEDSLQVRSVDGSQVMMVHQTVPSSSFEHYDIQESEELVFGTACDRLNDLLKAADDDTLVEMRLDLEAHRLNIKFGDVSYSLAGIDTSSIDEPETPDVNHTVRLKVHSSVFKRAHNVVGMIGGTLTFEAGDGSFRVHDTGDMDIAEITPEVTRSQEELQADGIDVFLETDASSVSAQFGDDYIDTVVSFLPDDYVTVELNDQMPMLMNAGRANSKIATKIFVAPRIEDPS